MILPRRVARWIRSVFGWESPALSLYLNYGEIHRWDDIREIVAEECNVATWEVSALTHGRRWADVFVRVPHRVSDEAIERARRRVLRSLFACCSVTVTRKENES